jgi:hypothetical protein
VRALAQRLVLVAAGLAFDGPRATLRRLPVVRHVRWLRAWDGMP